MTTRLSRASLCLSLLVGCADGDAAAEGDTGSGSVTSSDASTTDATGSVSSGSAATSTDDGGSSASTGTASPSTVFFINFDGADLVAGPEDATQDSGPFGDMTYEAFPGTDDIPTILSTLEDHWAGFDVRITDVRPAEGPYDMVVVTPTNPYGPEAPSWAGGFDCDNMNPHNLSLAFGDQDTDPVAIALAASRVLGYGFGVVRGADPKDLSAVGADPTASWNDECIAVEMPPSPCATQATAHCPTADEQNSAQILSDAIGSAR